jgi:hypothetical protein
MVLRFFLAPFLLILSICAAEAAPVDSQCAAHFMEKLADSATVHEASKFFDMAAISTANSTSMETALSSMMQELAGITHIEPLNSLPDGNTARVAIGSSTGESPFIGSAFSAVSGMDGRVFFFVTQRLDGCSIISLSLHLPSSQEHFEERARHIAGEIQKFAE